MGYLKGAGARRNGKNLATLAQYFAIGKLRGGGSRYGRGREPGVKGAGGEMFRPPCPPTTTKTQITDVQETKSMAASTFCEGCTVLSTYILSLLNDVSSSELASATLLQNFVIKSSLFSVTTNISDRRLFITPSSSSKQKPKK